MKLGLENWSSGPKCGTLSVVSLCVCVWKSSAEQALLLLSASVQSQGVPSTSGPPGTGGVVLVQITVWKQGVAVVSLSP